MAEVGTGPLAQITCTVLSYSFIPCQIHVPPPLFATGSREIPCGPSAALVSAVMSGLLLSMVYTIFHGGACGGGSADLQPTKWAACGTADHGLADIARLVREFSLIRC